MSFCFKEYWLVGPCFCWGVFQVGGTVGLVSLGISAPKKKSAVNRPTAPWEPLAPKATLEETNSWWKRVKISCTKRGSIHLVRLFRHFLSWKISRTFRRRRPDVKASLKMKNFLPRMPALEVWLETMQIQMLLSIWRWVLCPNCFSWRKSMLKTHLQFHPSHVVVIKNVYIYILYIYTHHNWIYTYKQIYINIYTYHAIHRFIFFTLCSPPNLHRNTGDDEVCGAWLGSTLWDDWQRGGGVQTLWHNRRAMLIQTHLSQRHRTRLSERA